jgi:DNA-binding CsgD family transcriptional regulator
VKSNTDWAQVKKRLGESATAEERKLLQLLIQGESSYTIARALGQHRSMIWRKIKALHDRTTGNS